MKTQTKTFYGALFVALLIAAPMMADARPFGHGSGPGGECYGRAPVGEWTMSVPEDKRDAVRALMLEHRDKVQPLRDKLWVKRTTLGALKDNPNVKPAELTALIEEMAALRKQLRDEHKAYVARVKQETGLDLPFGCGMKGSGFMRHHGMGGPDGPRAHLGGRHGGNHGGKGMR